MINCFFQREVQKGAEDTNLLSNIILLSCLCFSLKNGVVRNERDRFLNYVPADCVAESDRMKKESSEGLDVQMQMCEHLPGTLPKVVLEGWDYYGYSLVYLYPGVSSCVL